MIVYLILGIIGLIVVLWLEKKTSNKIVLLNHWCCFCNASGFIALCDAKSLEQAIYIQDMLKDGHMAYLMLQKEQ